MWYVIYSNKQHMFRHDIQIENKEFWYTHIYIYIINKRLTITQGFEKLLSKPDFVTVTTGINKPKPFALWNSKSGAKNALKVDQEETQIWFSGLIATLTQSLKF